MVTTETEMGIEEFYEYENIFAIEYKGNDYKLCFFYAKNTNYWEIKHNLHLSTVSCLKWKNLWP